MNKGCIHLYCGDGKGKTSAALGLLLRAHGAGLSAGVVLFLKDGSSSENAALQALGGITLFPTLPQVTFSYLMTPAQKADAAAFYDALLDRVAAEMPQVLLLDEVLDAVNAGLLTEARLLRFLRERPPQTEVVLTGRAPSPALCAAADYLTEMKAVKHPFASGMKARRGIEY